MNGHLYIFNTFLCTTKTIVLQIIMASNYFSDILVCSFSFTFIATFENPLKKVKKVSVNWSLHIPLISQSKMDLQEGYFSPLADRIFFPFTVWD